MMKAYCWATCWKRTERFTSCVLWTLQSAARLLSSACHRGGVRSFLISRGSIRRGAAHLWATKPLFPKWAATGAGSSTGNLSSGATEAQLWTGKSLSLQRSCNLRIPVDWDAIYLELSHQQKKLCSVVQPGATAWVSWQLKGRRAWTR